MNRNLVLGLGIAVGIGLGFAAGSMLGGAPTTALEPASSGLSAPESAASPSREFDSSGRKISTQPYGESTEALVDEVPESGPDSQGNGAGPETALDGKGTITGHVFSDRGRPLPNALVRASQHGANGESGFEDDEDEPSYRPGDGAPPNDDLRVKVRRFVDREGRSKSRLIETRTDEAGQFKVAIDAGGTYHVQAYAEGYRVQPVQNGNAYNVKSGMRTEFVGTPVIKVRVDVVYPDGTRPPKAWLSNTTHRRGNYGNHGGDGEDGQQKWTPSSPELRVSAGAHEFTASAGKKGEFKSEPQHLFVDSGVTPAPLVFALKSVTGIKGKIVFPPDCEPLNCSVHLLKCEGGVTPEDDRLANGNTQWIQPDNGLEFTYQELEPASYKIGVRIDGRTFVFTDVFALAEGMMLERDLAVTMPPDTGGVIVRVVGPDGALLRNANVWVNNGNSGGGVESEWLSSSYGNMVSKRSGRARERGLSWAVRRRKDGGYLILRSGTGDPSAAVLNVTSPTFGKKIVPFGAPAGELEVRLDQPGILEVSVPATTAASAKKNQNFVRIRPKDGKPAASDPNPWGNDADGGWVRDGRVTFGPLQPGMYDLVLSLRGQWSQSANGSIVSVDIRPGLNTATVTPPPVYKLIVAFGRGQRVQHVNLQSAEGGDNNHVDTARVDEDGNTTFDGIVAGDYKVVAWLGSDGERSMLVRVPNASVIRFDPVKERALQVKKLPGSSYLATVGLKQGDMIIGVNGEEFDGEKPAGAVLNGFMMARKDNNLMIHREGQRLEFKVEAAKFNDESSRQLLESINR